MKKGTRFFSRRLLPLLLAAVMLLGMLPALTLPVLAEEPTAVKLTTVATEVTSKGKTGDNRLPAQVVMVINPLAIIMLSETIRIR